ncbi:MAG: hypothetical protein M1833_000809 [Piccolia ochrophora]|nr:MAG: hypothetical protein M1833_000809 [Piccolia ochrophora]
MKTSTPIVLVGFLLALPSLVAGLGTRTCNKDDAGEAYGLMNAEGAKILALALDKKCKENVVATFVKPNAAFCVMATLPGSKTNDGWRANWTGCSGTKLRCSDLTGAIGDGDGGDFKNLFDNCPASAPGVSRMGFLKHVMGGRDCGDIQIQPGVICG